MEHTLQIRGMTIGAGLPGIIVPIVGKTYEEILDKAESLQSLQIDMVEWRADFFDEIFDMERVLYTASALRIVLEDTPLLFTFRTKKEGGEKEISPDAYVRLNIEMAKSTKVDLIDVEIFSGDEVVSQIINAAHEAGVFVVGSNHDFHATPAKEELINRFLKMQQMGADIPKIAVMPTCTQDVLTLLSATSEMKEKHADRPIIAMSMSGKGLISRLAGEVFGSSMTFGAAGQASAPGQIPVMQLAEVLNILHTYS